MRYNLGNQYAFSNSLLFARLFLFIKTLCVNMCVNTATEFLTFQSPFPNLGMHALLFHDLLSRDLIKLLRLVNS